MKTDRELFELSEPEPAYEPVCFYDGNKFYGSTDAASMSCADMARLAPLYTRPQRREPPTDEQIDAVTLAQWSEITSHPLAAHRAYARAILALVGIGAKP